MSKRIKFQNFLDTITSFIRTDATVARVYQFPNKDITVAGTDDVDGRVQKAGDTMSGALAMGTNKITGLGDPTNPQDAVTKTYADGLALGVVSSWKTPVRVATTANGTLASAFANGQTVDGTVIATDDRILLKNQTTQSENGLYTVNASGAPTRATDANVAAELHGAAVIVQEGTSNANTTWIQTTDTITLGSSNIVWSQIGTSVPDADASTKGIGKLYTSTGTGTDGSMTRTALTTAFDAKVDKETWTTLTNSSAVTWDTDNKQSPIAKLTSNQSFTLTLQNLKDGAHGILKLTTSTASAITVDPVDTTYTFKSVDNVTITDHTFPAATGKDYYIEFVVQGTTVLIVFNDYTDAPATAPSIVCSLERTSNQTITTATFTAVQFVTEVSDLHNMFDSAVSSTTITVPGSGAKLINVFSHAFWASSAVGIRRIRLLINGANALGREFDDKNNMSIAMSHNLFSSTVVAGGDTIQMQVYHTGTGDLNLTSAMILIEVKDIA